MNNEYGIDVYIQPLTYHDLAEQCGHKAQKMSFLQVGGGLILLALTVCKNVCTIFAIFFSSFEIVASQTNDSDALNTEVCR